MTVATVAQSTVPQALHAFAQRVRELSDVMPNVRVDTLARCLGDLGYRLPKSQMKQQIAQILGDQMAGAMRGRDIKEGGAVPITNTDVRAFTEALNLMRQEKLTPTQLLNTLEFAVAYCDQIPRINLMLGTLRD